MFSHACPDPGERARWLPRLFRWSAWRGFLFGQILGTAGHLDGVAVLIGPQGGEFTAEDLTRIGYDCGGDAGVWDQAVPEPHLYLDVLAVDPARQGRGIGSALLRAAAARADADELHIVLLTCQPRILSLYQRHDPSSSAKASCRQATSHGGACGAIPAPDAVASLA